MDTQNPIKFDELLKSILIEIGDFEERFNAGNQILQEEWDNMEVDWHLEMTGYLDYLISKYDDLSEIQRIKLKDVIQRVQKIKPMILEKNYSYKEIFDAAIPA